MSALCPALCQMCSCVISLHHPKGPSEAEERWDHIQLQVRKRWLKKCQQHIQCHSEKNYNLSKGMFWSTTGFVRLCFSSFICISWLIFKNANGFLCWDTTALHILSRLLVYQIYAITVLSHLRGFQIIWHQRFWVYLSFLSVIVLVTCLGSF